MHCLENDVSADAFPGQQRCNPGDAVAAITITSDLSREEKTRVPTVPRRNLTELFTFYTGESSNPTGTLVSEYYIYILYILRKNIYSQNIYI